MVQTMNSMRLCGTGSDFDSGKTVSSGQQIVHREPLNSLDDEPSINAADMEYPDDHHAMFQDVRCKLREETY